VGAVSAGSAQARGSNRGAITVCVILATLMQALDSTIANVALPICKEAYRRARINCLGAHLLHRGGRYRTPLTGYLATRLGTRRLFLTAIAGFTVASMLCGIAQSLPQIVLFRLMQGVFGAPLVPLSQSVLLDIYPKERQGFAMALFGMGAMAGPVLGPVIGGWLTDEYSWRFVFYINLPVGILDFLGMMIFLPAARAGAAQKLDWLGFGISASRSAPFKSCSTAASSWTGSPRTKYGSRPFLLPVPSMCFSFIPSPATSPCESQAVSQS